MLPLRPLFSVIILLIYFALSGCVTTEYQPRSIFGDGYSEARIGEKTYKVEFQCNEITPEPTCEGYLFRRCAELTISAGFDYFVMEQHTSIMKEEDTNIPGHYNTVTTGSGRDKTTAYVYQPGYVVKSRYPVSSATIKMSKGVVPKDTRNAYSPREILKYATN
jgi:hypothetical protein